MSAAIAIGIDRAIIVSRFFERRGAGLTLRHGWQAALLVLV
jgi:hypothetical protein